MFSQPMRTVMKSLAGWVHMCTVTCPWWYELDGVKSFIVPGRIKVLFDGVDPLERAEFFQELKALPNLTCNPMEDTIENHPHKYTVVEKECGFTFLFEDLTLHIVRSTPESIRAFITDSQGRVSRATFTDIDTADYVDFENPSTIIPWLHCRS